MSTSTDLHAALAQRLFGWHWQADAQLWRDPDGVYRDAATFRRRLPAYSIEPRATAEVWQWLETRGDILHVVHFDYHCSGEDGALCCVIQLGRFEGAGHGATWPEALCRAALALADALEREEKA